MYLLLDIARGSDMLSFFRLKTKILRDTLMFTKIARLTTSGEKDERVLIFDNQAVDNLLLG